MVNGDLKRAASDLEGPALAQAPGVMKAVPPSIESAEVQSLEARGDDFVVRILYEGGGSEATLESRWAEREGRPKIIDLRVL